MQEDRQPHERPVSVQTGPAHIYTTQQTTTPGSDEETSKVLRKVSEQGRYQTSDT